MTIMKHRAALLLLALAVGSASAGVARAASTQGTDGVVVSPVMAPEGFSDGTDGIALTPVTAPDGFSDGTDGIALTPPDS
ncbi:MAG: hypothetical protein ACXVRZ_08505 [Gaiellaceae bacterium]